MTETRLGLEDLLREMAERVRRASGGHGQVIVLSPLERALVLRAGPEGVVVALAEMLGDGRMAASTARKTYGALVRAGLHGEVVSCGDCEGANTCCITLVCSTWKTPR